MPDYSLTNIGWKRRRTASDIIAGAVFVALFCGTVFAFHSIFNDRYVQPKYYFLTAGVALFTPLSLLNCRQTAKPTRTRIDTVTLSFSTLCLWMYLRGASDGINLYTALPLTVLAAYLLMRRYRSPGFIDGTIIAVCIIEAIWAASDGIGMLHDGSPQAAAGSFDNVAGAAALLCMGLPLCLSWAVQSGIRRAIGLGGAVVIAITIIILQSRTGIAAIATVITIHIAIRRRDTISRHKRAIIIAGTAAVLLCSSALFLYKKDSAMGRILIWRIACRMIADTPFTGSGRDAFRRDYMDYQAEYFAGHSDSPFAMLAGDNKYAFNEYLRITYEYGVPGAIALAVLSTALLLRFDRRDEYHILALISLCIFALFSYPLRYPPVWIVAAHCIAAVSLRSRTIPAPGIPAVMRNAAITAIAIVGATTAGKDIGFETAWGKAAREYRALGDTDSLLKRYRRLYDKGKNNPYFLYDYARILFDAEQLDQSLAAIDRCRESMSGYGIEMLSADNLYAGGKYGEAIGRYTRAHRMCPSRFMPLRGLLRAHTAAGHSDDTRRTAREIIAKEEKVPSLSVALIKYEAARFMESGSAVIRPGR